MEKSEDKKAFTSIKGLIESIVDSKVTEVFRDYVYDGSTA